jgi:hypothetical protein
VGYSAHRIGVLMPEATVYEDHFFATNKDKIGISGQVTAVQAETITERVHEASDTQLGLHVFAFDGCHVRASAFATDAVHVRKLSM